MEEIKQELRQENVAVKATAVAKLTYVIIIFLIKQYKVDVFYLFHYSYKCWAMT